MTQWMGGRVYKQFVEDDFYSKFLVRLTDKNNKIEDVQIRVNTSK